MVINAFCNKQYGPGGRTQRLHHPLSLTLQRDWIRKETIKTVALARADDRAVARKSVSGLFN